MKTLLLDAMIFKFSINEGSSKKLPGGRIYVEGKAQHCGVVNRNNRRYPRESTWGKHVKEGTPFMERIKRGEMFGHLEHPEDGRSDLKQAAIKIEKAWMKGDEVHLGISTLSTPLGKTATSLFEDGLTVGISSRGTGSISRAADGVDEVGEDFDPETFDLVADPSTPGANFVAERIVEGYKKAEEEVKRLEEAGGDPCACEGDDCHGAGARQKGRQEAPGEPQSTKEGSLDSEQGEPARSLTEAETGAASPKGDVREDGYAAEQKWRGSGPPPDKEVWDLTPAEIDRLSREELEYYNFMADDSGETDTDYDTGRWSTKALRTRLKKIVESRSPKGDVREARDVPAPGTPAEIKAAIMRGRKTYRFGDLRPGDSLMYRGEVWVVYDADSDASAPKGFTVMLVDPAYKKAVRYVRLDDLDIPVESAGTVGADRVDERIRWSKKRPANPQKAYLRFYDKKLRVLFVVGYMKTFLDVRPEDIAFRRGGQVVYVLNIDGDQEKADFIGGPTNGAGEVMWSTARAPLDDEGLGNAVTALEGVQLHEYLNDLSYLFSVYMFSGDDLKKMEREGWRSAAQFASKLANKTGFDVMGADSGPFWYLLIRNDQKDKVAAHLKDEFGLELNEATEDDLTRLAEGPPAERRGAPKEGKGELLEAEMSKDAVMRMAKQLSDKLMGGKPEHVGEWRWSQKNESAIFLAHTPLWQNDVWVLLSVFEDGTVTTRLFSEKHTSELNSIPASDSNWTDFYLRDIASELESDFEDIDERTSEWAEEDRKRKGAGVAEATKGDTPYFLSKEEANAVYNSFPAADPVPGGVTVRDLSRMLVPNNVGVSGVQANGPYFKVLVSYEPHFERLLKRAGVRLSESRKRRRRFAESLDLASLEAGVERVRREINAPFVNAYVSTLGGPERASMLVAFSLDPREDWHNGIMENSRYVKLHLGHTGELELVAQDYKLKPKFRKLRVRSVEDAVTKINRWIGRFAESLEEGVETALAAGIENPNSSGQGFHPAHKDNPYHDIFIRAGMEYSHTTPVVHPGNDVRLHHTYRLNRNFAGSVHQGKSGRWLWDAGGSGSGRRTGGNDARSLEKYLKRAVRRWAERTERFDPSKGVDWDYAYIYASVGYVAEDEEELGDEEIDYHTDYSVAGLRGMILERRREIADVFGVRENEVEIQEDYQPWEAQVTIDVRSPEKLAHIKRSILRNKRLIKELDDEGYRISVDDNGIRLKTGSGWDDMAYFSEWDLITESRVESNGRYLLRGRVVADTPRGRFYVHKDRKTLTRDERDALTTDWSLANDIVSAFHRGENLSPELAKVTFFDVQKVKEPIESTVGTDSPVAEAAAKPIGPRNEDWGFWGTTLSNAEGDLNNVEARKVWDAAFKALAAMRPEASADAVRNFLDSRYGRHLADEVFNQVDGDEFTLRAVLPAVKKAVGRRGWWDRWLDEVIDATEKGEWKESRLDKKKKPLDEEAYRRLIVDPGYSVGETTVEALKTAIEDWTGLRAYGARASLWVGLYPDPGALRSDKMQVECASRNTVKVRGAIEAEGYKVVDEQVAEGKMKKSKKKKMTDADYLTAAEKAYGEMTVADQEIGSLSKHLEGPAAAKHEIAMGMRPDLAARFNGAKKEAMKMYGKVSAGARGTSPWEVYLQNALKYQESAAPVSEDLRLGPSDKKVIWAFFDKQPADSRKLTTDGERLDGNWMGGRRIAWWEDGKVRLGPLTSRSEQTVQRFIRRNANPSELGEATVKEAYDEKKGTILTIVAPDFEGDLCAVLTDTLVKAHQMDVGISKPEDADACVAVYDKKDLKQVKEIVSNLTGPKGDEPEGEEMEESLRRQKQVVLYDGGDDEMERFSLVFSGDTDLDTPELLQPEFRDNGFHVEIKKTGSGKYTFEVHPSDVRGFEREAKEAGIRLESFLRTKRIVETGGNPLPPRNSNWFRFAQRWDVGTLDLDDFAARMGFDDFYDLDISIGPRSLYRRDPDKFVRALRASSLMASDADVEDIGRSAVESVAVKEAYGLPDLPSTHDTLGKFWVVTPPTMDSEMIDIVFETDVRGIMQQALGGLTPAEVVGTFSGRDERKAKALGEKLLAALESVKRRVPRKAVEEAWGITSDGWDEEAMGDVGLMEALERVARLSYEIKSARRGSYARFGDTVGDLAQEVESIGEEFIGVAETIEGYARRHGESINEAIRFAKGEIKVHAPEWSKMFMNWGQSFVGAAQEIAGKGNEMFLVTDGKRAIFVDPQGYDYPRYVTPAMTVDLARDLQARKPAWADDLLKRKAKSTGVLVRSLVELTGLFQHGYGDYLESRQRKGAPVVEARDREYVTRRLKEFSTELAKAVRSGDPNELQQMVDWGNDMFPSIWDSVDQGDMDLHERKTGRRISREDLEAAASKIDGALRERVQDLQGRLEESQREVARLKELNEAMDDLQRKRELAARHEELLKEHPELTQAEHLLDRAETVEALERTAGELVRLVEAERAVERAPETPLDKPRGAGSIDRDETPSVASGPTDLTEGAGTPQSRLARYYKTKRQPLED